MDWFIQEIADAATAHSIDPVLVQALVQVESSGITSAYRFEPLFWARYLAKLPEWRDLNPRRVSASYGLGQIMYPTACECGFNGPPEHLFIPEIGLDYACRQLRRLLDWTEKFEGHSAGRKLEAALAAYNGGKGGNAPTAEILRNGSYARKVLGVARIRG